MELRHARASDLVAVGEVTVAAYASFTRGPQDPYVEQLRDATTRAAESELWVAVEGDTILVEPDGETAS